MATFNWREFLTQWSEEVIAIGKYYEAPYNYVDLPYSLVEAKWLGYSGASEAEILETEIRLSVQLPPTYREFLKVTNGWRQTSMQITKVLSVRDINWFRVENKEFIDEMIELSTDLPPIADEQYFDYSEDQPFERAEYFETALQISAWGNDATYLLNPQVITAEGEWEAWFFANWTPGARRYQSFWDLMQAEHESFLRSIKTNPELWV